jgi:hypothetical protein
MPLNLTSYVDMHFEPECKGLFGLVLKEESVVTLDSIGPVTLPVVPFVCCTTCNASYLAVGFLESIEEIIAKHLVFGSSGFLKKEQIRFLRLYFGKTQEEFAQGCGVSGKNEMSRMESRKYPTDNLSIDRQVRLRLYCASLFGNQQVGVEVNNIDKENPADFSQADFPNVEDLKHA